MTVLAGVRVLDFTRFQQGPYATRLLADMGADVIKVERPGGEWDRRLRAGADGFSGFFEAFNRGKRSVAVDLAAEAGRDVVRRLAGQVDVVVENFRFGVMDRMGLGCDVLRADNPGLVYAGACGYGPNGPNREEPMFDMVGQAVSGVAEFVKGFDDRPRLATRGFADASGAVFLALAIVSALFARTRTGRGQRVDASLVGACLGMHTGEVTVSLRNRSLFYPRQRVASTSGQFVCADDRWLVIAASDQRMWKHLCAALDRLDLRDEPRFAAGALREQRRDELERILEAAFRARPRDEWLARMRDNGVPAGPVNTFLDLPGDPDVRANGYLVDVDDPRWGLIQFVGPPFHLSETAPSIGGPAPRCGEHTAEVLRELGWSETESQALSANGVIRTDGGQDDYVSSSRRSRDGGRP
jgi:crotonobetainyl-CoA:carnitine CoA-transferase CaiB-like acyl-CoA transferase